MFENISQAVFTTGAIGYMIVVPVVRSLATLFMAISTYKLLKAREDHYKFFWVVAICFSPIIARIAFEVYCRWIAKKEIGAVKGSNAFLIASVIAFALSAVLLVASVISIGAGYLKSEIDGEPLGTFYDVHGNEYDNVYDVPLYDQQGNRYIHEMGWFTTGTFTDQNGNAYDADYCYLSEDGYFYFDEKQELMPCQNDLQYFTDGETVYYDLSGNAFWEADGTIYAKSGRVYVKLFDFD